MWRWVIYWLVHQFVCTRLHVLPCLRKQSHLARSALIPHENLVLPSNRFYSLQFRWLLPRRVLVFSLFFSVFLASKRFFHCCFELFYFCRKPEICLIIFYFALRQSDSWVDFWTSFSSNAFEIRTKSKGKWNYTLSGGRYWLPKA